MGRQQRIEKRARVTPPPGFVPVEDPRSGDLLCFLDPKRLLLEIKHYKKPPVLIDLTIYLAGREVSDE